MQAHFLILVLKLFHLSMRIHQTFNCTNRFRLKLVCEICFITRKTRLDHPWTLYLLKFKSVCTPVCYLLTLCAWTLMDIHVLTFILVCVYMWHGNEDIQLSVDMIYSIKVFRSLVVCMKVPTSDCLTNCLIFIATNWIVVEIFQLESKCWTDWKTNSKSSASIAKNLGRDVYTLHSPGFYQRAPTDIFTSLITRIRPCPETMIWSLRV